ncbi:hypothetical protein [Modestobacter sp. SYSU DS0290]
MQLLAAVRKFRRFAMYADVDFVVVDPTEQSGGTVATTERRQYDASIDEALSKLMIVARSEPIVDAARELVAELNKFMRERATYGLGNVPTETVRRLQTMELDFAAIVMREISPLGKPGRLGSRRS